MPQPQPDLNGIKLESALCDRLLATLMDRNTGRNANDILAKQLRVADPETRIVKGENFCREQAELLEKAVSSAVKHVKSEALAEFKQHDLTDSEIRAEWHDTLEEDSYMYMALIEADEASQIAEIAATANLADLPEVADSDAPDCLLEVSAPSGKIATTQKEALKNARSLSKKLGRKVAAFKIMDLRCAVSMVAEQISASIDGSSPAKTQAQTAAKTSKGKTVGAAKPAAKQSKTSDKQVKTKTTKPKTGKPAAPKQTAATTKTAAAAHPVAPAEMTPADRLELLIACLSNLKGYLFNEPGDTTSTPIRLKPKEIPVAPTMPEIWQGRKANLTAIVFALLRSEGIRMQQDKSSDPRNLDTPSLLTVAESFAIAGVDQNETIESVLDFLIPTRVSDDLADVSLVIKGLERIAKKVKSAGVIDALNVANTYQMALIKQAYAKDTTYDPLDRQGDLPRLECTPELVRVHGDSKSEKAWEKTRHEQYIVGGSTIAACFPLPEKGSGFGFSSPDQMYERLTSPQVEEENTMMEVGRTMQPVVEQHVLNHPDIKALKGRRIDDGNELLFQHSDIKQGCATTDMLLELTYPSGAKEDVVVEIKTTPNYYETYYQKTQELSDDDGLVVTGSAHVLPYRVVLQLHWQMQVLGLETGYVAVYPTTSNYPVKEFGGRKIYLHRIEKDPKLAKECEKWGKAMISCVEREVYPSEDTEGYKNVQSRCGLKAHEGALNVAVDGEHEFHDVVAPKSFLKSVRRRAELKEAEKEIADEIKSINEEAKRLMGASNRIVTQQGHELVKLSKSSLFNGSEWLADNKVKPVYKTDENGKPVKDDKNRQESYRLGRYFESQPTASDRFASD